MTLNPSLLALLIVPALVYLLVPLLILATFRIDAEITLAPTRVEDLGAAARDRLAWLLASLGEQGFIPVSNCRTPGAVPGVLGVQVMFVHPQARDVAYGMFASSGMNTIRNAGLTFRTYFADGTQIVTWTSTSPGSFPPNPRVDSVAFHRITDPTQLYAIHRARVLASGRAAEPTLLPQPGDELAFQAEDWRRELRHVEQTGNFRLAPDGQHFTMTPKGAYLMTGRIMWPGKWIRAARQRLQANRVLQNLRAAGHELPI